MTTESLVPLKTSADALLHVPAEPQDVLAVWNIEPQPVRKYVCEMGMKTWHSGWSPCCAPAVAAASYTTTGREHRHYMPLCREHAMSYPNIPGIDKRVVPIDVPERISTHGGTQTAANWVQLLCNPNFVPH